MKKVFGFIIVTLCLPTIWSSSTNIRAELSTAQAHEQQIQKKIEVPEVQVQLPVTLVDQNHQTFSEEYVEWRQPLTLQEIPQIAQEIFIASEDADFYNHVGFDLALSYARWLLTQTPIQLHKEAVPLPNSLFVCVIYLMKKHTKEN
ncbi:hypothetical protein LSPH24S_03218 [Lysinibacillus sphaericus]